MGLECSSFDEYSDKIGEADALSLMTAPLTGPLDFAQHVLPRTILQFGSGGSGTIVHGTTRSNPCFLFMQSATCANRIVFDGRSLRWPEIVMIPPVSHFTFACTGLMQWISLAVPAELTNGITNGGFKKYLVSMENAKTLITPPAAEMIKLIEAATTARNGMRRAQPAHLQAIEASLLGILDRMLLASVSQRRCFDKRTEKVMSTVLECLRRDSQIHVVALLLWGLHMVLSGVLRAFGPDLRRFLGKALRNRFTAFGAGLALTAVMQSSTATGLMTASLAADGVVSLVPALAIMLGANVGTTLIVQVLSFNVSAAAPVLFVIGLITFRVGG